MSTYKKRVEQPTLYPNKVVIFYSNNITIRIKSVNLSLSINCQGNNMNNLESDRFKYM